MQAVRGHLLNGWFSPIDNVELPTNVEVVLVFGDSSLSSQKPSSMSTVVAEKNKRQLGFLKEKIPSLPDSFFDPLPEEDLQAWGL